MTGRQIFSAVVLILSVANAKDDGCPVDLKSSVLCGPANETLRAHLQESATDSTHPLEEVEQNSTAEVTSESEAYDPVPKKQKKTSKRPTAKVKFPNRSQASPLAENDEGED